MKLHAAAVSAVEMLSLAEVRVSGKEDRSPAVALEHHDDTIDVRGLIPGQVLSSTVPDWLKKVSGTLRHQVFAKFSDASKVPDTFFNAFSCSWS